MEAAALESHPLISMRDSETVSEAARLMADCGMSAIGVLNERRDFSGILAERGSTRTSPVQLARVVVVSEDPGFIEEVRLAVENMATRVIACLGPTASPCFLEDKGVCPLVAGSVIVLVDAPLGGSFRRHWKQIAAGEYAERLQKAHPSAFVVLSANGCDSCGPAGEVAVVQQRETALLLLKWALPGIGAHRANEAMTTRGGAR